MNKHVRSLYLDWRDGRPDIRQEVERHLRECGECRRYFEGMDRFLDPSLLPGSPALAPDPSLPDRVAALSAMRKKVEAEGRPDGLVLSLQGAAFAAAVLIGVLLGMSLYPEPAEGDVDEIVSLYREAVQEEDAASRLETVLDESERRME